MAESYVSGPEPAATGGPSAGSEIRRLAGSKDANIEFGHPPGRFLREPVPGVERPPAPPAVRESRHVQRAPMDRDGDGRPHERGSVHSGRWVESGRASRRAPPPDGKEGDIDMTGQSIQRRVEVGVPGEVHPGRSLDQVPEWSRVGSTRPA